MPVGDIIQSLTAMKSAIGVNQLTINEAVETMRKYQKIEQILQEQCIIPEGCYPKLKKIKEVVEDGNVD